LEGFRRASVLLGERITVAAEGSGVPLRGEHGGEGLEGVGELHSVETEDEPD
jgi:hypothetical protein